MAGSLEESVNALEASVMLLQDTVELLKTNSHKSTSLTSNLLHSKRIFQLVPEYDVQRAKLDLIEDVDPLVSKLSGKLDKSLNKLERERSALQQTFELNKLRLNNKYDDGNDQDPDMSTEPVVMVSSTNEELEELKQLKQEKEKLLEQIQAIKESRSN